MSEILRRSQGEVIAEQTNDSILSLRDYAIDCINTSMFTDTLLRLQVCYQGH